MVHMSPKMCQMESVRLAINEHMTSVVGEDILCVLEKQQRDNKACCCVSVVRVFVLQRLSAAAGWMCNLFQREMETLETLLDHQSKLLDMAFNVDTHTAGSSPPVKMIGPHTDPVKLIGPDADRSVSIKQEREDHHASKFLHRPVSKEEVSPEEDQQVPPQIKEEQEALLHRPHEADGSTGLLHRPHEADGSTGLLHRPHEADGSTLTLLAVTVKSEDDADENRDTAQHMKTQADAEDCESSQPTLLSSHCSESDTEDSDEWEETSEDQSVVHTPTSQHAQRTEGRTPSASDETPRDVESSKETNSTRSRSLKLCVCNVCGKSFNRTDNLKTHMRIHTGEKPFSCSVCSKSFTLKQNLKTHMGIHKNEKQFCCAICFKSFTRNAQLKKHRMEKHTGENLSRTRTSQSTREEQLLCLHSYESDTVGREGQSALHTLQSQHVDGQTTSCTVCGKSFKRTDNLKIHMRTHSGDKPFSCAVCRKSFTLNQNLKTHMRIHTNEKPFSCAICDKGFAQKIKLKTHMSTHTGERPFWCTVCSKTFNRTENLKTHMMTHTGEKPFSCTVCDQSFRHRGTLTNHMRTHTGDKPFSCTVCGQRFSRSTNLKLHEDSHNQETM